MFEEEILIGDTERRIVLETRCGTRIKNTIPPEPGERERGCYDLTRKRYGHAWVNRK
jgi:hypothetical protein